MANWNCDMCKGYEKWSKCIYCDDGSEFEPYTNADRIRAMSDEELAEFFDSGLYSVCLDFQCEECNNALNCDVCYLEWLKSEVKE